VGSPQELDFILNGTDADSEVFALDLETTGGDVMDDAHVVVAVGLSNSRGSVCVQVHGRPDIYHWILRRLVETQVPLIMHNAYFDLSFLRRDLLRLGIDTWPNFRHCTYSLYRLTSTEDWDGFSWGLKAAQKNLLGWQETNETRLDEWLVSHGFISNMKIPEVGINPSGYYLTETANGSRWAKPQKQEMWRAPFDILGHYCALDCDATYSIYKYVLLPCVNKFKGLQSFCSPEIYGEYTKLLIEQKLRGNHLDIEGTKQHLEKIQRQLEVLQRNLFEHKDLIAAAEHKRSLLIQEHLEKEPARFKVQKLGIEPVKFTKKGQLSRAWVSWDQKRNNPPKQLNKWTVWKQKLEVLQQLTSQELINLNSGKQKVWLFYEFLKYPVLLTTKKQQPATGKDALKGWGELGVILQKQNKLNKEAQYTAQCIDNYNEKTAALHPSVLVPGTSSGRLAGAGGMNYQQMPKSYGLLSQWKARPGYKLVDMDFTALESVVITELSRDESMMKLYGPDANPNQDIHLFTGSMLPGIGEKIRKAGYDPDNPTQEGVERAKKECKKEREIAKTINYASVYKAGPRTLARNLTLAGIPTSEEVAAKMHAAYWETYKGVKQYSRELERQWKLNGGWFLNGIGRPVSLTEDLLKDTVSRCVQSTGHSSLILLMVIYWRLLKEHGIEAYQWMELHDQLIVEVREDQAERAARLLDGDALQELNRWLGGMIPLRGEAQVISNLAEAKNLKPEGV
jgi:DNA polymerase I-like protein with 3'-5' exonuclease and polymerase domains